MLCLGEDNAMKKLLFTVLAACLLALPAFADSGEKCTASAQMCLNRWSKAKSAGWAGLEYDKSQEGVIKVKAVTANSPAAMAGFEPGDVLVALNGVKMSDKIALKKAKGDWKVGQAVTYLVKRGDLEKEIAVTLAETPPDVFASNLGQHMLENHVTNPTAAATKN
jgi:predicted metalloprotease with PDZ domain